MQSINLLKQFLMSIITAKKVMNEHFNKILMSGEDDKRFQSSNKCWICNKLFTNEAKIVRDHDHITSQENVEVLLIQVVILILN